MPGTKNGRRSLNSILGFPSDKDVDFLLVHLLMRPSMKRFVFFLGIILFAQIRVNAGETWTLTDKSGRSIEVDYLHYNGVELTVQRLNDYRKLKISPDTLDSKCWKKLNDEFGANAAIRLEVERTTKTDRDTQRTNYSGYYYGYTQKIEDVQKLSRFTIELRSSSYFESEISLIYYILSSDGLDVGKVTELVSLPKPLNTTFSKMLEKRERSSSDTYWGTYYRSTSGDTKADFVAMVYNTAGELIADYSTSVKAKEYVLSVESAVARKLKLGSKKKVSQQLVEL